MKLEAGSHLPGLTLHGAGADVRLRSGRGPLVLLAVHSCTCPQCRALVEGLGSVADGVREWGGRVAVVVPVDAGDDSAALERCRAAAGEAVRVVADPDGEIASGAAVRIVIADEWGEVYFSVTSADDHALITPREVVDWVRFIVIQCPECEGPEGEWRSLREA